MSHSAQKRPANATPTGVAKEERTGRFSIEETRRGGTVLPPPSEDADLVSLEEVGAVALAEEEPSPAEPSATRRGTVSGVFAAGGVQTSAPPPIPEAALHPAPRHVDPAAEARRSERAQLQFEDLSLRPDNPYAASSLVPPPRKPISPAKVVGVVAAVLAIASGGWFAFRAVTEHVERAPQAETRPQAERVAARPATPRETAPVPAAPAAPANAPAIVPDHVEVTAPERSDVARAAAPVVAAKPAAAPVDRAADSEPAPAAAVPTAPAAEPVVAPPQPAAAAAEPVVAPSQQPVVAPSTVAALPTGDSPPVTEAPVPATADQTAALAAPLPLTPTREQVVAGFEAIQPELVQCAAGKHGVAQISATIAGSGRISYALVGGKFQGTVEGSCMARVVRGARFPQFSQPTLKVSYPVSL
jgi:hypothetical protein